MNYYILTAGILSAMATVGHFTMGLKDFLKPVISSSIDEIPKKVMESIFHYMSVFLIVTSIVLLAFSFGENLLFENTKDVTIFIGIIYGGFGILQIIIALASSIQGGVFKLFQWVFWLLIAVLLLIGIN